MSESFRTHTNPSTVCLSFFDLDNAYPSPNLPSRTIITSSLPLPESFANTTDLQVRAPRQNTILNRIYSRLTRRLRPHYTHTRVYGVGGDDDERARNESLQMFDEVTESPYSSGLQNDNVFDDVTHTVTSSSEPSSLRHPWLWRSNNFRIRRDNEPELSRFRRVPFFRSLRRSNLHTLPASPTVSDFTSDESLIMGAEEGRSQTSSGSNQNHSYHSHRALIASDSVQIEFRELVDMRVERPISIRRATGWMTNVLSQLYSGRSIPRDGSEADVIDFSYNYRNPMVEHQRLESGRSMDVYHMLGRFEDHYASRSRIKRVKGSVKRGISSNANS